MTDQPVETREFIMGTASKQKTYGENVSEAADESSVLLCPLEKMFGFFSPESKIPGPDRSAGKGSSIPSAAEIIISFPGDNGKQYYIPEVL